MKRTRSPESSAAGKDKERARKSRWSSDEDDSDQDEKGASLAAVIPGGAMSGGDAGAAASIAASDPIATGGGDVAPSISGAGSRDVARPRRTHAENAHIPLFHGCRSVENYQRLNYISAGTYGVVFRAMDKASGDVVALKQIKFDQTEAKQGFPTTALRETNILLALQHPNIIRVREMVVGSSVDKVFMVMDYLENDLKYCMDSMTQPFTLAETKTLMLQILRAVDHMHERWYIHRDLKTSNILYGNSGNLVVCDFGMARKYGSPLMPYTFEVITLWYRPLELLLGSRVYSTAVDMWSVGCIFGEILTRKPLFPGEGEIDQITKICRVLGAPNENNMPGFSSLPDISKISWKAPSKGKLRELFPHKSFAGGVYLNDTGFDLLSKLLLLDPKARMSSKEALNHPWFTEAPLPCPKEHMPTFKSRHENVNVVEEE